MPAPDESQLVAVALPAPDAADAVRRVWDRGAAVAMLDPEDPGIADRIATLAPTRVIDRDGEHRRAGGSGVAAGVAAVVPTSGTTRRPRLVELTRDSLSASAYAVHAALSADPARDHWLACLPLHHVAGLAIVARAHVTDTPLTVHPRFDVDAVADAAGECTLVSVVPTTLARLLATHPAASAKFRRVLVGGGPIPAQLLAEAEDAGVTTVTTYGLTETGGGCVHDGQPLASVEIALAPESSEILVRGPVVMQGYREAPAATSAALEHGWLRTGDIGRWDPDGRLEVVDRIKDLVITGGVNVSPVTVESRLSDAPGVADLAVVGAADPEWGERVVACVVPADLTDPPTLDRLRAAGCAAGLRPAELPRELRIVDRIPRSSSDKILRRRLRSGAGPAESSVEKI